MREQNVVDIGRADGAIAQIPFRVLHDDAIRQAGDGQVGEGAIADDAIAGTAHAHALAPTVEHAVRDGHILAHAGDIVDPIDGADDQAVVCRLQDAVADRYIATGIDIDAVVVDHPLVAVYPQAMDADPLALHQPERPTGGVHVGRILEAHIVAAVEHDQTRARGGRFGEETAGGGGGIVERQAIAVHLSRPGDGDIVGRDGADHVLAASLVGVLGDEASRHKVIVVLQPGTAEELATRRQVQFHIALQLDGAGKETTGTAVDHAAARLVAGIDGRLDRDRVQRRAVRTGTEVDDISSVRHGLILQG